MWWGSRAEITNFAKTWEKYSHQDHKWGGHQLISFKPRTLHWEHLSHRMKQFHWVQQTLASTSFFRSMGFGARDATTKGHSHKKKGWDVHFKVWKQWKIQDSEMINMCMEGVGVGEEKRIENGSQVSLFLVFLTGHLGQDSRPLGRSLPYTAGH